MRKNNHHYLDSNIVLSVVLPNDISFEKAKKYLEQDYNTLISSSVSQEAENKINNLKRISLKISDFVFQYSMDNNVNFVKIDLEKSDIEKNFLKQYKNNEYPENIQKSKFEDIVHEFFMTHEREINDILIINDDEKLISEILITFKLHKTKLNTFIESNRCITFISTGIKYNDLKKLGIHTSDAKLLDEAYHLHLTLNAQINFITLDNNILKLKNEILNHVSSNLIVSSPIEFVSVNN